VVAGIPILIDETASSFRISDYERPMPLTRSERVKRVARTVLPRLSLNVAARRNYRQFRELLFEISANPRVLIIGGATAGAGTEELLADGRIDFVSTDAAIDDHTALVCDAQVLPFADQTFHGIIFQAVMFYLPEYQRCINEMLRVLKPQGVVYSETAFMEQVVGGEYDFYRFTLLGHEYQFRQFEKVSSGVSGGPAMATAWSIQYLLLSFTENSYLRAGIRIFCKCTLFWMKYFDLLLVHKRGAVDAAAGTYFMGRRPAEVEPGRTPPSQHAFDEAYQGLIQSDVRAHR
jgi:SAM-dependent methyltransferase